MYLYLPEWGSVGLVRHRQETNLPLPDSLVTYRLSLHFPVSMTYLMPGMVIEVSAIFVARMHFLEPCGVGRKILDCCDG